jgi:hypothetical protein
MPNYNDNDTRDNSIDQLPRMIFQLPNTESGATSPTINPVFFCQSGCAIEYNFSNIKSCQFNNDGKKFTITPTDTANINYIMWNGTDINSGEKMTQFTLKEIYFTAPAKDHLGTNTDIISQSIQYYFVFVNEKYNNLMICISVIGSVNNMGNAPKSNGFSMLETLATRIPSINIQSQLNNLNNFNLGTLIPPNKPFFSTLITNNIQYIIITEVVDIPIEFFSNMATMVNGGTQLYNAKMNQNRTNIPQNSPTTILFYNENSQLLNDNQNLVCNSSCDLVPAKKITPTIGTYTTTQTQTQKKKEDKMKTITGTEVPPEKCEMEEVWANQSIKPLKDPNKPDGKIGDPNKTEKDSVILAITVSFIFLLSIITGLFIASNIQNIRIWFVIIIALLIMIPIIVGFNVGYSLYYKDNTNHWIPYVVGLIIWVVCMFALKIVSKKYYSSNYSSFNLTTVKQQPYAGINVPVGFNEPKSWFSKIFSSKPTTNYSPQITVPSTSNTQPKKSLIDKIFKRNSQSDSTLSTSTASTAPSAPAASASAANLPVSQQKQSFLSSINPFSKQDIPLTPNIIQSKTELIKDIQQSILSQANKNKLIKTLNSSKSSNIVQRLNNVYKELNKLKLKST